MQLGPRSPNFTSGESLLFNLQHEASRTCKFLSVACGVADMSILWCGRQDKLSCPPRVAAYKGGLRIETWNRLCEDGQLFEAVEACNEIVLPTLSSMSSWERWQDNQYVQAGRSNIFWEDGQLSQAVEALGLMVQRGSYVDTSVLYTVLKRCIAQKDLYLGSQVHAFAVKSGYESNPFLANHIICMYACHGKLKEAKRVFTNVRAPNRFMWASIILAHARHGKPLDAIQLYHQMRSSRVMPDNHIFVAVLKACATSEDLSAGREVHADILATEENPNIFVGNCLVDMYAKCGSLQDARKVFNNLATRDVVTWNSLIAGYAQHGLGQEALALYAAMLQEGSTAPDAVTFVSLLQACAGVGCLREGKRLHEQIFKQRLEANVVVGTGLVDMYAKCGSLEDARRVFDRLPTRDVFTWNVMIAGYVQHDLGQEALTLYESMQQENKGDKVTLVCLLQACASSRALQQGKQLHEEIQKKGLEAEVVVGTCLVDMYAKCGSLDDACRVFNSMPTRNVVTWTAMIAGYARHGLCQEALTLHESMQLEGITPANAVTFVCLLQACASMGALHHGEQLHRQIKEQGLEADTVVANCLVNMYAKCGTLEDARRVFDNLPMKNVVTWNAMIAGYAQQGRGQDALALYGSMAQQGITSADAVTFACLLQACGSVAALEKGKDIHAQLFNAGFGDSDLSLANAIVDMYGKCGSMVDAQKAFDALRIRDTVTWNALIAGYARHGESEVVFDLFQRMRQEGIQPDGISFLSVLTVCSHVGLLSKGLQHFEAMSRDFGISPAVEHYNCMVDLLGRAGHVDKAVEMVRTMPFQPDRVVWRSILGACRKWKNVELGKQAFQSAVKLDQKDSSPYILMSNIYAAAQMKDRAQEIRELRVRTRAWKQPGQSWWTDIDGIVHTFVVGDKKHPEWQHIDAKLKHLFVTMKERGYVPHLDSVLREIPDDEKEAALCGHSEKLAIAYALHKTPEGATIRVVKNLRVCEDCHMAIALISQIERRTIICRDGSRFHVYKEGKCSCRNYW